MRRVLTCNDISFDRSIPNFTLTLVSRPISVQELIEKAPGDIKCPSCSAPLTVDLSSDGRVTGCGSTKGGIKGKGVRKDKGTEKSSMTSPSAGGFGSKRFVTKHSVMNRIDLTKFQSVGGLIMPSWIGCSAPFMMAYGKGGGFS